MRTEQDKLSAGLLFFLVELTFLLFAALMSGSKSYPSRLVCISPVFFNDYIDFLETSTLKFVCLRACMCACMCV